MFCRLHVEESSYVMCLKQLCWLPKLLFSVFIVRRIFFKFLVFLM